MRKAIMLFGPLCAIALGALPEQARAVEGGTSLYILGTGGPAAAVMPPVEGVFFDNTVYIYDGKVKKSRDFILNGNVVTGLDATVVADFVTTMWVPSKDFLGGTLAAGVTVPIGAPIIDVDAVLTGPRGNAIRRSVHDSALVVGDPVASLALGWQKGDLHIQASAMANMPIGRYREGQLANFALHRWAVDTSLALSWHGASGWDVSAKAGVTFNGRNETTDYDSGNELHGEFAVERTFSKTFSAGVQGYFLNQISGDKGAGARLGTFKGEVAALGLTAAYNTVLGRAPATFRIKALKEFGAKNRLEGKAFFVSLSLPLSMRAPG